MKKTMLVMAVIVLAVMAGYSEDAKENKEPAELTAAKKEYAEQLEKVTAPVKAKQIARLEKLKKQLTTKGDLQGALAVQKEIEALEGKEEISFVGKWNWAGGGLVEIKADGTATFIGQAWKATWKEKDGKAVLVWSNGAIETVSVASDGNSGKVVGRNGVSFQISRDK